MQMGFNIIEVFDRLSRAIKSMESKMKFSYSSVLGTLSSCPTNLGTAMRASVVKLYNLLKNYLAY
jgi:arginine kinase